MSVKLMYSSITFLTRANSDTNFSAPDGKVASRHARFQAAFCA